MGKEASNFNIFNNISVSGSASVGQATFTSSATGILYRDDAAYQVNFTGFTNSSFSGILQFNGSNDYNPQLPQSGNTQNSSTNGNWFTFASASMGSIVSPYCLNMTGLGFTWLQFQYISATSSGVLTSGWISTKSVGS